MTEWPATIDRRYHDAVILGLDSVVTETARGIVEARDSTVPTLRRLQDVGAATAVCSSTRDCAQVLRNAGIDELVSLTVGGTGGLHTAALAEAGRRLRVRPVRCVVIDRDQAGVNAGSDGGFGLVIGLGRNGQAEDLLSCGADTVVADLAGISVRSGGSAMSRIADGAQSYEQVKELVANRRPVVFVDFDGTLSNITELPDSAILVDGADEALRALAAQCPVAVISGRDVDDVRERVKIDGVWYFGNHGFELIAPDGTHHERDTVSVIGSLARTARRLAETLRSVSGIVVEHKRFTIAVHYRNADPEDVDRVVASARDLGRSEGLRITPGRKVIELRPTKYGDKGTTLNWLLHHIVATEGAGPSAILPIYIGDDITDEDAFDVVHFDGVGIVVRHNEDGDRPSAALFSLESPSSVAAFVGRLAKDLEQETNSGDAWELVYEGYDPKYERLREALCTVGNGYIATRGCAPEAVASEAHYPGTYAAGVYNTLADRVAGRTIENESLVNLPNWLSLTFRINGGTWFHVDDVELFFYRQTFDLRHATVTRILRFRDSSGQITTLSQQRFASMHQPHVVAMQTKIGAEN